jgi:hypothetical protein
MSTSPISIFAATAVALAGLTSADIVFPTGSNGFTYPAQPELNGRLTTGYASQYISRGLSLKNSGTDHVGDFEALFQYALPDNNALFIGGRYLWLTRNGTSHAKEPDKAALKAYVKEWMQNPGYREYELDESPCDEATFTVQFAHYFTEHTMLAGGYEFVHGGLPGRLHATDYEAKFDAVDKYIAEGGTVNDILSAKEGSKAFNSDRAEEHSVVIDFHHEFNEDLSGFFFHSRTRYVVQWESGWWFTNTLGYKASLCDTADFILSASWVSTLGYFDSDMANGNGTQSYIFSAMAPIRICENVIITPHATCALLGNGAKKGQNKIAGRRFTYGEYSILIGHAYDYEDVAFDFGLSATCTF